MLVEDNGKPEPRRGEARILAPANTLKGLASWGFRARDLVGDPKVFAVVRDTLRRNPSGVDAQDGSAAGRDLGDRVAHPLRDSQ